MNNMTANGSDGYRKCPNFQDFAAVKSRQETHGEKINGIEAEIKNLDQRTERRFDLCDEKINDNTLLAVKAQVRVGVLLAVVIPLLTWALNHYAK